MSELAPLQTFDPKAFVGNTEYSQDLCDCILGLALIHNDVKGTMAVIDVLNEVSPKGKFEYTSEWGECTGRDIHVLRYHVGMLNEILIFLQENEASINSAPFQDIVKLMAKTPRECWLTLVDMAAQRSGSDPFSKILIRLRNNLSFHYSASELGRGYRRHFESGPSNEQAFISKGQNMAESRFYFADAAAQDYILSLLGGMKKEDFQFRLRDFYRDINKAFYTLVDRFITKRGFAFRVFQT